MRRQRLLLLASHIMAGLSFVETESTLSKTLLAYHHIFKCIIPWRTGSTKSSSCGTSLRPINSVSVFLLTDVFTSRLHLRDPSPPPPLSSTCTRKSSSNSLPSELHTEPMPPGTWSTPVTMKVWDAHAIARRLPCGGRWHAMDSLHTIRLL